jgi:hypothetical protein
MNKKRATRKDNLSNIEPQTRELIEHGLAAATKMSSTGWIALVAILAILLAGYAIHAVVSAAHP